MSEEQRDTKCDMIPICGDALTMTFYRKRLPFPELLSLEEPNNNSNQHQQHNALMSTRSSPSTTSTTSPPNAQPSFSHHSVVPQASTATNTAAMLAVAAAAASRYSPSGTPNSFQDIFSAACSSADFDATSPAAVAVAAAAAAAAVANYPQQDSNQGIVGVPSPIFPPPPITNGHGRTPISPQTGRQDFSNASEFLEAFARSAGATSNWRNQVMKTETNPESFMGRYGTRLQ